MSEKKVVIMRGTNVVWQGEKTSIRDVTTRIDTRKFKELQPIYAVMKVIQGHDMGRDYRLRKSEYMIGRSSDCEIVISERTISRQHAKIQVSYFRETDSYNYRLIDLESTNHTYVNNEEIQDVILKDGDKVIIGNTILKFELLDEIDIKFHKEIQEHIKYNSLTQLLTKESFCLALEHELRRCLRFHLPLSIMMLDLDHFKKINDTYGHEAGNHIFKEISFLIRRHLRKTDVSGHSEGKEFLSYLSEQTKETAQVAADYLRMVIENAPIIFNNTAISVTTSIGIAQFPIDGTTVNELLTQADAALYKAKNMGRNQVCLI